MVGKRIVIFVIVVLLCSCVTVGTFADSVSQYSDAGGYDENQPSGGVHGEEIGILATPTVYHAPLIDPLWYQQVEVCPHCRATGSTYIGIGNPVNGYQRMYCLRCSCEWLPLLGGIYKKDTTAGDRHFHILTHSDFCPYLYGIDYGINSSGRRSVQFYCPIHNVYSSQYSMSAVFEFNTRWGLRVIWWEDWVEPTPNPNLWLTPFVPPYDSFATLEPVSVDDVGDIVDDTVAIVKVVYKGFPYFSVLLTIAIACAFIVVVVRG